jgi:hypothetical protein
MRRRDFVKGVVGSAVSWPLSTRTLQAAAAPINEGISGSVSSAGVFDSNGKLVRTLWSGQRHDARVTNPVVAWDGTLDDNSVAPRGDYTVKLLTSDCKWTWEGVVGSTSALAEHSGLFYHCEACPISDMDITAAGTMFYATGYDERWNTMRVSYTSNPERSEPFLDWHFRASYNSIYLCCSDGTLTYWAHQWAGTASAIFAASCTPYTPDAYEVRTVKSDWAYGASWNGIANACIAADSDNSWLAGIAVQTSGNVLATSSIIKNTVYTYNKTTGQALQSYTTWHHPGRMQTSPAGDLWLVYSAAGTTIDDTVIKLTVDNSGHLTASGVAITVADPMDVAISPDGATVLVLCGGTTQQVKAFNASNGTAKTAWGNNGALGTLGGYANSPAVTDTKFMFTEYIGFSGAGNPVGYVAYEPDGSFWIGDSGNCRNLHFSSGNAPTLVNKVSWIPAFYSCRTCINDPTRIFAVFLEFKIDYSKPLSPTNGSWTLVNNWAYGTEPDQYAALQNVGTYSNGRTYGTYYRTTPQQERRIYELTSTGRRDTGVSCWIWADYRADKDFNFWLIRGGDLNGQHGYIYKNPFTGFDASGNPTWKYDPGHGWMGQGSGDNPATNVDLMTTFGPVPSLFPNCGSDYLSFPKQLLPLSNGTIPIYNPYSLNYRSNVTDHLAGVDAVSGDIKFITHPVTNTNFGDWELLYPPPPYFPVDSGIAGDNGGAAMAYVPGDSNIFTFNRGENWGNNQVAVFDHWHESGLMVSRGWEKPAPYYASAALSYPSQAADGTVVPGTAGTSFKGMTGLAGNVANIPIVKIGNDIYLYCNDEWYHGGIHRWKVSGLDSIKVTSFARSWDAGTYQAPTADPTDMLAGLPYNATNIADGTAGWHRTDGGDIYEDWSVGHYRAFSTNRLIPDPRQSPDLCYRISSLGAVDFRVWKAISVGTGPWYLDSLVVFAGGTQWNEQHTEGLFVEIRDAADKIILRAACAYQFLQGRNLIGVNDPGTWGNLLPVLVDYPNTHNKAFQSYIGRPRKFRIDVSAVDSIKVTYDTHSLTFTAPWETGAAVLTPAKFVIHATSSQYNFITNIGFTKLNVGRLP